MSWLEGYLERSLRPWIDWLSDHPSSALGDATITEIHRLLHENIDFWRESAEAEWSACERETIGTLLERYETVAQALDVELRVRARLGAADLWARIERLDQAERLYRAVLADVPRHPEARAALDRLT